MSGQSQNSAPGLRVALMTPWRARCGVSDYSHHLVAGLRALPEGLRVRRLNLSGCIGLRALPAGLSCYELTLHDTPLRSLPSDLRVEYRLDLSGCQELETLPTGLKVGSLVLENCTALRALPEGLDVCFLDISGCSRLQEWPNRQPSGSDG